MQRALNYDLSPALSVPLRFFLSALFFALLGTSLLLWAGPTAFSSRWTPAVLAMTHLWLLGCITLSIIGALFQLLPVVGGRALPLGNLYANTILVGISGSALLLALAFLLGARQIFPVAASMAGGGLLLFLVGGLQVLTSARQPLPEGAKPMYRTLAVALGLLSLVLLGGVVNALLRSGAASLHYWIAALGLAPAELSNTHAILGLSGWVVMVVMAVTPQVIPMFQVTEPYPPLVQRHLPLFFASFLLLWLLAVLLQGPAWLRYAAETAALFSCAAFALVSLITLRTRKRAQADATTGFWYTALVCLLLSCLAWMAGGHNAALTAGVLLLGFAFSAVNGMLYQIVPFLIWLHAHRKAERQRPVLPKMRDIIPLRSARRQCALHTCAVVLLACATLSPNHLTRPAAFLMLGSLLWLCLNLWKALLVYRRALHSLAVRHAGP